MIVCTAPSIETRPDFPRPWVFLAGGISNCPDWRRDLLEIPDIQERECTFINPRQEQFDFSSPMAGITQVSWEFAMLNACDAIVFWFARGSDNPITLFEYGRWMGQKSSVAGVDPQYSRRQDVALQTTLYCPDLPVYDEWDLFVEATCELIDAWREQACTYGVPLGGQPQAQA